MYLELRSRIPVVAEQTDLGTARIEDAQRRVGLSNEAVARKVPVSEKTWRRWKQAGKIPTASLPAVARALNLELHALSPEAAQVEDREVLSTAQEILRELRELRAAQDEMRSDFDQRLARLEAPATAASRR